MSEFTALEWAALRAIFSEAPELEPLLVAQAARATVTKRENTGHGFFTHISVPEDCEPVQTPSPIGEDVYARIDGIDPGLGLLVFLKDGRIKMLEGFGFGQEDTKPLAFDTVDFQITNGRRLAERN